MIFAKEIRQNQILRIDGKLFSVLSFDYHSAGKMVTAANAQLRELDSGNISVRHFKPDEKVDDVHLDKKNMEFLYEADDQYFFMDPDSFEQFSLQKNI
ncbi:MAG: hypothetical protein Q8Q33_05145, partial [Chlamydiota bacterium]|nr:hypothetical protein [Chlamydiota bacterium]